MATNVNKINILNYKNGNHLKKYKFNDIQEDTTVINLTMDSLRVI